MKRQALLNGPMAAIVSVFQNSSSRAPDMTQRGIQGCDKTEAFFAATFRPFAGPKGGVFKECVYMAPNGGWYNAPCKTWLHFVCEKGECQTTAKISFPMFLSETAAGSSFFDSLLLYPLVSQK